MRKKRSSVAHVHCTSSHRGGLAGVEEDSLLFYVHAGLGNHYIPKMIKEGIIDSNGKFL